MLAFAMAMIVFSTIGTSGIHAASVSVADANRLDLFFNDIVLRGTEANQDSYFEIGKGLKMMPESYLDLYLSHSPSLIPEYSSVNILIDDLPIETIRLTSENTKETNLQIPLSDLDLAPGYHKVSFRANMKVAIDICEDPESSSAWMVLYEKSKLVINLAKSYEGADLAWYPSPYFERGTSQPVNALIVVPEQLNQAEFVAAARLSQFFATQTPGARLNIPIYTEADLTNTLLRNHNIIWIGQPERWSRDGRTAIEALRQSASLVAQSAFLGTTISPWNPDNVQLILAGNGDTLQNGATILSTESLYRQLAGTLVPVPENLSSSDVLEQSMIGKPYIITLEKLGYNNLAIRDLRKGTMEINYSLPGNWDLKNGAQLELVYSHSQSIMFNVSVMTVSLNGVPVKSTNLTQQTADKAKLHIDLSPAVIGNNRSMNIKVEFAFSNPPAEYADMANQELICADPLLGDWAVIDKSTSFTFTPVERKSFYLQTLPYPFVTNGHWDKTAFLFNHLGSKELNAAMTLIGRMGTVRLLADNDLQLLRTSDPELSNKLKDVNVIYVGTHQQVPDLLNGYNHSYIRFENSTMLSQSPDIELLDPLKHNSAVIQLTRSPFQDDRSLLMLSAASPNLLSSIAMALTDPQESGQISTRISVIDSSGKVFAFPATEDPYVSVVPDQEVAAQWGNWSVNRHAFTVGFLMVICLIGIIYWMNRRRKS